MDGQITRDTEKKPVAIHFIGCNFIVEYIYKKIKPCVQVHVRQWWIRKKIRFDNHRNNNTPSSYLYFYFSYLALYLKYTYIHNQINRSNRKEK